MKTEIEFKQNIELDARLVLAGMRGGMDAIINFAFGCRHYFEYPDMAVDRCYWFKKQPETYIKKVCDRVVELEKQP